MMNETGKLLVFAFGAVAFLIVVSYFLLLFNPPTELDKQCVGKTIAEVNDCIATRGRK